MVNGGVIDDYIIRFSGDTEGPNQLLARQLILEHARSDVDIRKYRLGEFFDRNFKIPDYQRGYEWEEEQWDDLWEEIEPIFTATHESAGGLITDVFFGSMFFAQRGVTNKEEENREIYDVIDGQQRLTTLTILFKIIHDELSEAVSAGDTELVQQLGNEMGNVGDLVYVDPGAGGDNKPSLELGRHNEEFFDALIRGEENLIQYIVRQSRVHGNTRDDAIQIHSYLKKLGLSEEMYLNALLNDEHFENLSSPNNRPNLTSNQREMLDRHNTVEDFTRTQKRNILRNKVNFKDTNLKLVQAYDYFQGELDEYLSHYDSPKKRAYVLTNVKNYILNAFHVGYFNVDNEQPRLLMRIFEILNDRGVELKKTDIIRTRIVGRFQGEPEEEIYIDKWESVINEFNTNHSKVIDFLKTYFVVRESNISSRGEISDRLLEAFTLSKSDDESRKLETHLDTVDNAENLLDKLEEYAPYYNDILDPINRGIKLGEDGNKEIERECNRIIARLDKAGTSVWQPLALAIYHDVCEEDIGKQTKLLDTLQVVESLAIRFYTGVDVNLKDTAYANAVDEFSQEGLDGDIAEELITTIQAGDPELFGADLVESLCETEWRQSMGKQVLRKIASEAFEPTGENPELVLKRLNIDDSVVHLEHIFPKSPFLEDDSQYDWFHNFFKTEESNEINNVINNLSDRGEKHDLDEIANYYIRDIGNLTLLRSTENIRLSNKIFSEKVYEYNETTGFGELEVNHYLRRNFIETSEFEKLQQYLALKRALSELDPNSWENLADDLDITATEYDEFERTLLNRAEELQYIADKINSWWTYDTLSERRAEIIEAICESIKFKNDEFDNVNISRISREETTRRNDVIAANYRQVT